MILSFVEKRKFALLNKGQLMCIVFVEGKNRKGQNVMGFLDLRERGLGVLSPFDLHRDWITPTQYDLTFFNFSTVNARTNSTKVCSANNAVS